MLPAYLHYNSSGVGPTTSLQVCPVANGCKGISPISTCNATAGDVQKAPLHILSTWVYITSNLESVVLAASLYAIQP